MGNTKLGISSMTLSIDFQDKQYGSGTGHFMNLSAKTPENETIDLEDFPIIIEQGLDMYFTIWQTLMAGRFCSGSITGEDYKAEFLKLKTKFGTRLENVKKFLRDNNG